MIRRNRGGPKDFKQFDRQEFALKNQALVMMASISALAQSSSSVTGEVLATAAQAYEGGTYQTAFRQISSVTLKQSATSLVESSEASSTMTNSNRSVSSETTSRTSCTEAASVDSTLQTGSRTVSERSTGMVLSAAEIRVMSGRNRPLPVVGPIAGGTRGKAQRTVLGH